MLYYLNYYLIYYDVRRRSILCNWGYAFELFMTPINVVPNECLNNPNLLFIPNKQCDICPMLNIW